MLCEAAEIEHGIMCEYLADASITMMTEILGRLQDRSMPCDGAWPPDRVGVFERWTAAQTLP